MGEGQSLSRQGRPGRLSIGGPAIPPPDRAAGAAPIIVTATMGAADQRHFDTLRRTHYPLERNQVAAHITLFHQLPPSCLDELDRLIRTIAADTPRPMATLRAPYSLGSGIAFAIHSPDLIAIREHIADHFTGALTAQDWGMPSLHITIQNKVAPAQARRLLTDLTHNFEPRPIVIAGLAAHHYRGGPWEEAFTRNFRGPRTSY